MVSCKTTNNERIVHECLKKNISDHINSVTKTPEILTVFSFKKYFIKIAKLYIL